MQGFQVPLIVVCVIAAVNMVSTAAPTSTVLANAQALQSTLIKDIAAQSEGHKCNVGDSRHTALLHKQRAKIQERTRTAREHNFTHERHVAPAGCMCEGYPKPTRSCGNDYDEYSSFCGTTDALLAEEDCNIGEFDTFESGGDTYLMCITESDAVKAIEANKRGGLWQNFGGDGGIPTSHASFGCASAINYARPLSPCYYTELMDAYAQVAVTSMSAPKADTASAKHTLKIRFNMLDLAAVPDPFADEFCSERRSVSSVILYDFDNDGVDETCFCSGSADQCIGAGCEALSDSSMYDTSCTDCSCAPADEEAGGTYGTITDAYISDLMDLMNAHDMFAVGSEITFAGVLNSVAPSVDLYARLLEDLDTTANDELLQEVLELFGIASTTDYVNEGDVHSAVDLTSEYIEVIAVPNLGDGTLGFATPRGEELGYSQPALYLSQSGLVDANASDVNVGNTFVNTIIHEVGHLVGLLHTFSGTDILVNSTDGVCDICTPVETNGETAGDMIADTTPTGSYATNIDKYPNGTYDAATCTKAFGGDDRLCMAMQDDVQNNFMSYDLDSCQSLLTTMQTARARCYIDQDFRDHHVTPTLPHGIVIFRVENPEAHNEYAELKWLPPVSVYWCKEIGGCVDGYVIERADSSCDSDGSSGEGESEVDAQAEVWNVVGQTEGDVHRWLDPTAINGASRYTYRIKALGSATSDQRSFTQELDICNAPTKVIQVKEEEEEGEEEEEEEEEEVKRVPDSSGAVGTVSGRLAVAVVLALSAM